VNLSEALLFPGRAPRRRKRPSNDIQAAEAVSLSGQEREQALATRKALIVVESEGTVFDSLAARHRRAYLPAFVSCFSFGAGLEECATLWINAALNSRLRGQDPLVILLYSLRRLEKIHPSPRRLAAAVCLENLIAQRHIPLLSLAESPDGSSERLILDWLSMASSLLEDEGEAPCYPQAKLFFSLLRDAAPNVQVLAHSSVDEALALHEWEMAGLGDAFLRLAGRERGDFSSYLRQAIENGFDSVPLLVIGSTLKSWQAAQAVCARFYPILPGKEDDSWEFLSKEYFPSFIRGEAGLLKRDVGDFMRMIFED
jgi:hypothetical protein